MISKDAATTKDMMSSKDAAASKDVHRLNVSFACGGWFQNYLFGSAKCMQDSGLAHHVSVFGGTSAGSLAAAGLALDADFDAIMEAILASGAAEGEGADSSKMGALAECHSTVTGTLKLRKYLKASLDEHGHLDRYAQANGRLQVNYTELPRCARVCRKRFASATDLETSILASACVPPLAGLPFRDEEHTGGKFVLDGGLVAFQPTILDDEDVACESLGSSSGGGTDLGSGGSGSGSRSGGVTVRVSPLWFADAEIKPSIYLPLWWAGFPPGADKYRALYDLGYADTLAWLHRMQHQHHPQHHHQQQQQQQNGEADDEEGQHDLPQRRLGLAAVPSLDLGKCEREAARRRRSNGDWLHTITGGRRQLPDAGAGVGAGEGGRAGAGADAGVGVGAGVTAGAGGGQEPSSSGGSCTGSGGNEQAGDGFVARFIGYDFVTGSSSSSSSSSSTSSTSSTALLSSVLLPPSPYSPLSAAGDALSLLLLFAVRLLAPVCFLLVYCELGAKLLLSKAAAASSPAFPSALPSGEYKALLLSPALFLRTCEAWVCAAVPWLRSARGASVARRSSSSDSDSAIGSGSGIGSGSDSDSDSSEGTGLQMPSVDTTQLQQHSAIYRLSQHMLRLPELRLLSSRFSSVSA